MEEAGNVGGMRDKFDQKGDEVIDACTNTAVPQHEASRDSNCVNTIRLIESFKFANIIIVLL